MPLSSHPRRTLIAGTILLVPCVAIAIFGAFAANATYPTQYSIAWDDVLHATGQVSLAAAFGGKGAAAILVAVTMAGLWGAYVLAAEDRRARQWVARFSFPACVLAGAAGGVWFEVLASPAMVLCSPLSIPHFFFLTVSEVEMLHDAYMSWIAVGFWFWVLAAIELLNERHLRLPAHHCQHCTYDRAGLDPPAPCPECGGRPMLDLRRRRRRR